MFYYQLCPVPVDSEEKELRVIFLLKLMLFHGKPLLRGQPPLSGHLPVPRGWELNGSSTTVPYFISFSDRLGAGEGSQRSLTLPSPLSETPGGTLVY